MPASCAAIASLNAYNGLVPISPKTTPSEAITSADMRCEDEALIEDGIVYCAAANRVDESALSTRVAVAIGDQSLLETRASS